MTTIDTLLTLDADDPALRRGIAELLGYHLVDQEEGWIVYPPPDAPREVEDHWHYNRVHLKPEDAWPTAMTMIPDWPHSVDAALGLCADDPRIWRVELTLWPAKMARADIWMKPPLDLDAPSDHYATMGGNEGEPKSPALAICRAWLASKR